LCVFAVPAAAGVDVEEAPAVEFVFIWHEYADAAFPFTRAAVLEEVRVFAHPFFPDYGQEQRAC